MNLIIVLLVMVGAPSAWMPQAKAPKIGHEPEVFYYDGKSLSKLDVIFVPNIRRERFHFFVKSPHELRFASLDSSEIEVCLAGRAETETLRLKGRWYKIEWETELRAGSEKHELVLISRSGVISRKKFVVNVEGSKKIEKPPGVIK